MSRLVTDTTIDENGEATALCYLLSDDGLTRERLFKESEIPKPKAAKAAKKKPALAWSIVALLHAAGVTSAQAAAALSDEELLAIEGVGPATVKAIRKAV